MRNSIVGDVLWEVNERELMLARIIASITTPEYEHPSFLTNEVRWRLVVTQLDKKMCVKLFHSSEPRNSINDNWRQDALLDVIGFRAFQIEKHATPFFIGIPIPDGYKLRDLLQWMAYRLHQLLSLTGCLTNFFCSIDRSTDCQEETYYIEFESRNPES